MSRQFLRFAQDLFKFIQIYSFINFLKESSNVLAVGMRVSDGRETGNTLFIELETFKLQIYVVNNTG